QSVIDVHDRELGVGQVGAHLGRGPHVDLPMPVSWSFGIIGPQRRSALRRASVTRKQSEQDQERVQGSVHLTSSSMNRTGAGHDTACEFKDPHQRRNSVPSGSSRTCLVPAGAVSVNSVLGSSAKTKARKRDLPLSSTV